MRGKMTKSNMLVACSVVNEESNIERWLDHWTQMSSDIILIDQSSTDRTPEIIHERIASYPSSEGSIMYFRIPHLGMCEPPFSAVQKMTNGQRWLLKVDADEFIPHEQWDVLQAELERTRVEEHVTTCFISRKNLIDGRNASPLFANQFDQEGRDWQVRLMYGLTVGFGYSMHRMPAVNGRFAYLDPDKFYIEHVRTFEGIVRANSARMSYAADDAKMAQIRFIQAVAQFLGKTREEYEEVMGRYEAR